MARRAHWTDVESGSRLRSLTARSGRSSSGRASANLVFHSSLSRRGQRNNLDLSRRFQYRACLAARGTPTAGGTRAVCEIWRIDSVTTEPCGFAAGTGNCGKALRRHPPTAQDRRGTGAHAPRRLELSGNGRGRRHFRKLYWGETESHSQTTGRSTESSKQ